MGLASGVALIMLAAVSVATANPSAALANGHTAKGLSTIGTGGWKVLTSATATQGGAAISTPGFDTGKWLSVTPDDAGAPGTRLRTRSMRSGST